MSLYGLKEFSSQSDETLKVVSALNPYIRDFQVREWQASMRST